MTTENDEQKQKTRERISRAIRTLYGAYKASLLYAVDHPSSAEASNKFVAALAEVFKDRLELLLQHTDGLFTIDEMLFIEESLGFYDLLRLLEQSEISSVLFLPGVNAQELSLFFAHVVKKSEGEKKEGQFNCPHIRLTVLEHELRTESRQNRKAAQFQTAKELREQWFENAESIFSKLMDEQSFPLAQTGASLDPLIEALTQNPTVFAILFEQPTKAPLPVRHSVDTMILSLFIAQQLGFDQTAQKFLAISALVHDVGRLFLPSDLVTGRRLAAADTDLVQLHATDGASFLAGVPGLPIAVFRVALEHHIGFDGVGYPEMPAGYVVHPFSRIVALADFASWATVSESYYHRPVRRHRLVRALMRRAGNQFDPLLVKLLIPFFGLYPSGTEVRLADGERAVVLESNLRNVMRPAVAVEKSGQPAFKWTATVDPAGHFPCSIARGTGRAYDVSSLLPLVPDLAVETTD